MKKAFYTLLLISLFSCSTKTITSSNSEKESSVSSSIITEEESSSVIKLDECNFTMDLTLYKNCDIKYDYENEYGKGIVTTNKIYVTCDFIFNETYQLSDNFKLFVNEEEIDILFKQSNNISYKVEDVLWSNIY